MKRWHASLPSETDMRQNTRILVYHTPACAQVRRCVPLALAATSTQLAAEEVLAVERLVLANAAKYFWYKLAARVKIALGVGVMGAS